MAAIMAALALALFPAAASAAPQREFESEISGCGSTEFTRPLAVAVDSAGDLYAIDSLNSVLYVIGPTGACMKTIFGLEEPKDVAVDSLGNVYLVVASPPPFVSYGRLLRLSPSQYPPTASTTYSAPATVTEGAEGENLRSVAVDGATDRVYVNQQKRVGEFKSAAEGSGFVSWIGEGDFGGEGFGVAVDEASGDIYATSKANLLTGIYRFDGGTHALLSYNNGSARPAGAYENKSAESIDVDQQTGDVLVWDSKRFEIDEFTPAGGFVTELGPQYGPGVTLGPQNGGPIQIAVANGAGNPHQGSLYIPSGSVQPPRVYVYSPLRAPKPIVATQAATAVTPTSATLNGTVNPNGVPVEGCEFEYVSDEAFKATEFATASTVPCAESLASLGSGTAPVAVEAQLSGLTPGIYEFRLKAENENGSAVGVAKRFGPPSAETLEAFPEYTEARLTGAVDTGGLATEYFFEYGATSSYGQSTPHVSLSGAMTPQPVEADVTGLLPGQTYHFRLVAVNEAATANGADATFDTLSEEPVETCPNGELRVGLSARLPDCRAYELVTPPFMNGLSPIWLPRHAGPFPSALTTPEGTSVLFDTEGTIPGQAGSGVRDGHRAVRTSSGWTDSLYTPSGTEAETPELGGVSPDHRFAFFQAGGNTGSLAHPELQELPEYLLGPDGVEPVGVGTMGVDLEARGRRITAGGARVVFTSRMELEANAAEEGLETVYARPAGGSTAEVISILPSGEPAPGAEYVGISEDGSAVAFRTGSAGSRHLYVRHGDTTADLGAGDPEFAGLSNDGSTAFYAKEAGLYAFDIAGESAVPIATGGGATFVNVSADGSHVYFTSTNVLTGTESNRFGAVAEAGKPNLYVWSSVSNTVSFIAVLDPVDLQFSVNGEEHVSLGRWIQALDPANQGFGNGPGMDPSRSTPDGTSLVFESQGPLTDYDSEGVREVYRYSTDGSLECVSCPQKKAQAAAHLELTSFEDIRSPVLSSLTYLPNVSENGQQVFFMTAESLVPEDVNGKLDVYEWRQGRLALISSGRAASSYIWAISPSGHDVFFATEESLVPRDDVEVGWSIYDARVDGGFEELPSASTPCQGEACQPSSGEHSPLPAPASEGAPATNPPRRRHCPKGKHEVRRHGKVRCVRHKRHSHRHRHGGRAK